MRLEKNGPKQIWFLEIGIGSTAGEPVGRLIFTPDEETP